MRRFLLISLVVSFAFFGFSETLAQTDDVGNEPTAFEASLLPSDNVEVRGQIEVIGDVDCFMFEVVFPEDSNQVNYTLETSDLSGSLDTVLVLFDRNGRTVLAIDDNSGQDRGSRIEFAPSFEGLYFVCVRNARSTQGAGSYTLSVINNGSSAPTTTVNTPPAPTTPPATPPSNNENNEENTTNQEEETNNEPETTSQPPQQEETNTPPVPETPEPPTTNNTPPETEERPTAPSSSTEVLREGRIALLGGDDDDSIRNVQSYLMATGSFPSVDVINVSRETPSEFELNQYEAVLVWADSGFQDADAMGDRLASYVDRGGGVVVAAVSFDIPDPFDPDTLGGRFFTGNYYVIQPDTDNVSDDRRVLGNVQNPNHPVMLGVTKIDGGPSSLHSPTSNLTSGGQTLASWDNGSVLVAAKSMGQANRVDINLFPPSSLLDPDLWPFTQDNDVPRLMVNALFWVAGRDQPFTETPEGQPGLLEASVPLLNFNARPGDTATNQNVTLRNVGGQSLTWSASVDVNWISLNPSQGELGSGDSLNVSVSANPGSLGLGTHNGTITFMMVGGESGVVRVPVTLTLNSEAAPPTTNNPQPPSTPSGSGNVLQVPTQFSSLSGALAQAQAGDVIEIDAGTLTNVAVTISQPITIRGSTGLTRTVLRGSGAAPVITVGANVAGVNLQNITINSGRIGVLATDGSQVALQNVVVTDNSGWGVQVLGASIFSSTGSTIASNGSGGITLDIGDATNSSLQVLMNSNTIQNNSGCGVHVASDETGIQISGSNNRVAGNNVELCDNANRLPANFVNADSASSNNSGANNSGPSATEFDDDGDGVPDADDFCPITPGRVDNNGCP